MDLQLKDKKALVMGSSRGIGRAIADRLAREGCDVAICGRNPDGVDTAVSELGRHGSRIIGRAVDINDAQALQGWIKDAAEELGGLDILVSNASAFGMGAAEDTWKSLLNVDILGAVRAVETAVPFLKEAAAKNGDAAIIAIGSVSAAGATQPDAYGAIKGALVHYVKGLARSLAKHKVRANVISPGMVYFKGGVWNMIETNMPEMFEKSLKRNPTGRMGKPEEMADAAAFLCSPCSAFTTGINMVIDGGVTDRVNY